jgi:glycosyltransferase involved in cell wall biosynthesis
LRIFLAGVQDSNRYFIAPEIPGVARRIPDSGSVRREQQLKKIHSMEPLLLGFDLQATSFTGAGVVARNTLLELLERPDVELILLREQRIELRSDTGQDLLARFDRQHRELMAMAEQNPGRLLTLNNASVLLKGAYPLFSPGKSKQFRGGRINLLNFVFENTVFSEECLREMRTRFDGIVVASNWCRSVLNARGLTNVHVNHQTVDPDIFHPDPEPVSQEPFTVFSGGKFEFRKGQDIVAAAFARFVTRHPDARLLALWHNPWYETMLKQDYFQGFKNADSLPQINNGQVDFKSWIVQAHGIPEENIVCPGKIENKQVPDLLKRCSVAVFPNRAEGGTNIIAMEAMACGLPCVLSRNTGHLDLVENANCLVLKEQAPIRGDASGTEGWGESSVDELIDQLEFCYTHRHELRQIGLRGHQFMRNRTWKRHVDRLVSLARGDFS